MKINEEVRICEHIFPNRVVLQPMEGCDCHEDGTPSALTREKYVRAAKSGAGRFGSSPKAHRAQRT